MQFEPQKLNDKKKIKSMLSSNLHIYAMSDVHLEICTQIHTDKQVYTLMVTEKRYSTDQNVIKSKGKKNQKKQTPVRK